MMHTYYLMQAALAHWQKIAVDAKPGAGRLGRLVTGERQPIISEDADGTGFAWDNCYEVHVAEGGAPLNGDTELMLEGVLRVGHARVMELRKLNGKKRVPRLSVRATDASRCMAVVQMLSRRPDGRWEAARTCPTLVPVLSLGRRVLASEGAGSLAGTFLLSAPAVAAGGPQLRDLSLSSELFKASSMQAVVSISKLEYQ